jgi:hypothetical protein
MGEERKEEEKRKRGKRNRKMKFKGQLVVIEMMD